MNQDIESGRSFRKKASQTQSIRSHQSERSALRRNLRRKSLNPEPTGDSWSKGTSTVSIVIIIIVFVVIPVMVTLIIRYCL